MFPILHTVEKAFAELAVSASVANGNSFNVYTGMDDETKASPCVICFAETATEDFPNSGNYRIKVHLITKEAAADTDLDTDTFLQTIYQTFLKQGIEHDLMNAVSGLFVFGVFVDSDNNGHSGDMWQQTLSFEVVACLTA